MVGLHCAFEGRSLRLSLRRPSIAALALLPLLLLLLLLHTTHTHAGMSARSLQVNTTRTEHATQARHTTCKARHRWPWMAQRRLAGSTTWDGGTEGGDGSRNGAQRCCISTIASVVVTDVGMTDLGRHVRNWGCQHHATKTHQHHATPQGTAAGVSGGVPRRAALRRRNGASRRRETRRRRWWIPAGVARSHRRCGRLALEHHRRGTTRMAQWRCKAEPARRHRSPF